MPNMWFGLETFGEKCEDAKGFWRLAKRFLDLHLFASQIPICTVDFSGLDLARRKQSAIFQKAHPIADFPDF